MIFYHPQIMANTTEARVFMVDNPKSFEKYEDHRAAIFLNLQRLINQAIQENDDPQQLIEGYLQITNHSGNTPEELSHLIFHSGKMTHALGVLKENWSVLDPNVPNESLLYGGISSEQAETIFIETDLRAYLESLYLIDHE